jgi:hypothetical protein
MIERIDGAVELGIHIIIMHWIDVPVIFRIDIRILFRIQCAVKRWTQIKINLGVVPVFEALGKPFVDYQQASKGQE